jgi:hypothetical protein
MDCKHSYELDLDGKVSCPDCHAVVDEMVKYDCTFWASQTSFEE